MEKRTLWGEVADEVRRTAAIPLSEDECWREGDEAAIVVWEDGTWCLPGTFGSTYGTWRETGGGLVDVFFDEYPEEDS